MIQLTRVLLAGGAVAILWDPVFGFIFYFIFPMNSIAKYYRNPLSYQGRGMKSNFLGWCSFSFYFLLRDGYTSSFRCYSLGRLTYAFCIYSRNWHRITGCEHLMQMEHCGISLNFSETQYDKLVLGFLSANVWEKRDSGFSWHFFKIRINLMKIYFQMSFLRCFICDKNWAWYIFSIYMLWLSDLGHCLLSRFTP